MKIAWKRCRLAMEGAKTHPRSASVAEGYIVDVVQSAYAERGRYDELADNRYTDTGAIFDIMALTVIQNHLVLTA